MEELDMDELHQKVNAIMDGGKKPAAKGGSSAAKKSPAPAATTKPQTVAETPKTDTPADDKIRVSINRPSVQVPRRSRTQGAAMDIVQPKVGPKTTPPSNKARRVAPSLQPTQSVKPEPAEPAVPPTPTAASQTQGDVSDDVLASLDMHTGESQDKKPDSTAPTDTKPQTDQDKWPDPLDFHKFEDDDVKGKEEPAAKPQTPVEPAPTMATEDPAKPTDPASSPFVTTKVEKRPLGAYADTTPKADDPAPEKADTPAEDDLAPATAPTQQPKELGPDVVAVESAETMHQQQESDEPTTPSDLRQMSIPQQYHTAEQKADTGTRPVFDTKEYHAPAEPVQPVHRTGSAWGWVLIVLLVVVLFAAGAVAYFAIMGDLDIDVTRFL